MRANFSAEYFAFFTIFAQNPVACAELPHSCLPLDSSAFQPITPRFPSMQKRSPPHNHLAFAARNGAIVRHKKGPSHDGPFLTNGCLLAEQRFDIQTLPLQDFTQAA